MAGWCSVGLRHNQRRNIQELHKMDGGMQGACLHNAHSMVYIYYRHLVEELRQSAEPDIVIMLVGNKAPISAAVY